MPNELKEHQVREILRCLLIDGAVAAVGEYRGSLTRGFSAEDPDTKQSTRRVSVIHTVECGARRLAVTEYLPEGSDESSLKAPAQRGEMVLVRIRKCSVGFKPTDAVQVTGHIIPLLPIG